MSENETKYVMAWFGLITCGLAVLGAIGFVVLLLYRGAVAVMGASGVVVVPLGSIIAAAVVSVLLIVLGFGYWADTRKAKRR